MEIRATYEEIRNQNEMIRDFIQFIEYKITTNNDSYHEVLTLEQIEN
jgi:hypothetical protein